MAGAKTKLTEKTQALICEAIETGASIHGACGYAGIVEQTFYNWYNKGKSAKKGKHRDFYCAVELAKQKATVNFEQVITKATVDNWQAAAGGLERSRPEMYRKKEYKELEFEGTVKEDVTVNLLDRVKKKRSELNEIRGNRK